MKKLFTLMALCLSVTFARDPFCDLVGMGIGGQDADETFLGLIAFNTTNPKSIVNPYGNYGSKYSQTSILNEYGSFGSKYAQTSAYNEYATKPPFIYWVDKEGYIVAEAILSKNKYANNPEGVTGPRLPIIDPDYLLTFFRDDSNCLDFGTTRIRAMPKRKTFGALNFSQKGFSLNGRRADAQRVPR